MALSVESQQNYPDKALFSDYQITSVSIKISAKCIYLTVKSFKVNRSTIFFKTKLVYSVEFSVLSFAVFAHEDCFL